jgi:nitric oxide reductase large subunit
MKTVCTLLLVICSFISFASDVDFDDLKNRRINKSEQFHRIKDSLIFPRYWKNTLMLEQAEMLIMIDDSIMNHTMRRELELNSIQDSLAELSKNYTALQSKSEQLEIRTLNDIRMLLILKVVVALLLVGILITIYFIYKLSGEKNKILENNKPNVESERDQGTLFISSQQIDELQIQNELLKKRVAEAENQLQSVKTKYESMVGRINKLITDLSRLS